MKTPAPHRNNLLSLIAGIAAIGGMIYGCQPEHNVNRVQAVAHFNYTSERPFPVLVQFVNTSVEPGAGTSLYKWDFGDGTTVTSLTGPSHYYVAAGTYIVTLVQIPPAGPNDTMRMTLLLAPSTGPSGTSSRPGHLMTANFNYSVNSMYQVTFTNTSTDAGSYLWNFGDGATSTTDSATVKHYYGTGSYHVVLTAHGDNTSDTSGAIITIP